MDTGGLQYDLQYYGARYSIDYSWYEPIMRCFQISTTTHHKMMQIFLRVKPRIGKGRTKCPLKVLVILLMEQILHQLVGGFFYFLHGFKPRRLLPFWNLCSAHHLDLVRQRPGCWRWRWKWRANGSGGSQEKYKAGPYNRLKWSYTTYLEPCLTYFWRSTPQNKAELF